ncbi:hypothetical protein MRX96_038325 [Rhipicephalus microplus]
MAQELGDELGRVLRERGPIGTTLDRFERETKLRREYLVPSPPSSGCWAACGPWTDRSRPPCRSGPAYWLIYVILNYYLGFLVRLMGRYFIKIYMVKFLLLTWCALPIESNGSDFIYNKMLAHRLFRPTGMTGSVSPKKTAAPPPGDERRDKMRSRHLDKMPISRELCRTALVAQCVCEACVAQIWQ